MEPMFMITMNKELNKENSSANIKSKLQKHKQRVHSIKPWDIETDNVLVYENSMSVMLPEEEVKIEPLKDQILIERRLTVI